MKLLALNCEHCGAPLEVPPKVRYATCIYCASQLEIHRTGSAAYTEVLGEIDSRTEKIARDVEILKKHQELAQLDRDWMAERAKYMIQGKDGQISVPNKAATTAIGGVVVAFGVFWTVLAGCMFPPMALFGVLFVGVAIWQLVTMGQKAEDYQRRHRYYEQQREALCRAIRAGGE